MKDHSQLYEEIGQKTSYEKIHHVQCHVKISYNKFLYPTVPQASVSKILKSLVSALCTFTKEP
jgi:hypothetical protein